MHGEVKWGEKVREPSHLSVFSLLDNGDTLFCSARCILHIARCFCTPLDNPIMLASSRPCRGDVRKECHNLHMYCKTEWLTRNKDMFTWKSSNRQLDWMHYLTQIILSYRKLVPFDDDLIPVPAKHTNYDRRMYTLRFVYIERKRTRK